MSPEWNWGTDGALLTGSPAPALGHFAVCRFPRSTSGSTSVRAVCYHESMWQTHFLWIAHLHAVAPKHSLSCFPFVNLTFFEVINSTVRPLSFINRHYFSETTHKWAVIVLKTCLLGCVHGHFNIQDLSISIRDANVHSGRHFLTPDTSFCNFIKGFPLVSVWSALAVPWYIKAVLSFYSCQKIFPAVAVYIRSFLLANWLDVFIVKMAQEMQCVCHQVSGVSVAPLFFNNHRSGQHMDVF